MTSQLNALREARILPILICAFLAIAGCALYFQGPDWALWILLVTAFLAAALLAAAAPPRGGTNLLSARDPQSSEAADFAPVTPWPVPSLEDCCFYTCVEFPDGEVVADANWDLRERFTSYIGNYPLTAKSVLDVGTASGFLAFAAEAAGAAHVTAIDAAHASEFERIPFAGGRFTRDRAKWHRDTDRYLVGLKNSFWYSWYKWQSSVEVVYTPVSQLWRWERRFDVVIAGAIMEHISDPVPFLGALAGLANEAVIIAFTPVTPVESLTMEAMNAWDKPLYDYSWWSLSLGLYRQVFANLGFSVELVNAEAVCNEYDPPLSVQRPTLIARRTNPA